MSDVLQRFFNSPTQQVSKAECLRRVTDIVYVFHNHDRFPAEFRAIADALYELAEPKSTLTDHKIRKKVKRIEKANRDTVHELLTSVFGSDPKNPLAYVAREDEPLIEMVFVYLGAHGPHRKKHFRKYLAYLSLKGRATPKQVENFLEVSAEWVDRFIHDVNQNGLEALREDRRRNNGKKPTFSKPEVISAICAAIREPAPDGFHWKGKHVQALMVEKLGFKSVPIQRAAENLKRAKEINQKSG